MTPGKFIFAIFWIALFSGQGHAQNKNFAKGNKLYEQRSFYDAGIQYRKALKAANLGLEDKLRAQVRLGECYLHNNQTEEAFEAYKAAAQMPNAMPVNFFRYADLCRSRGNYEEAKSYYEKCIVDSGLSLSAGRMIDLCVHVKEWMKDSAQYRISRVEFNTPQGEMCAVNYNNGIAFASDRRRGFFCRKTNDANLGLFYDLYFVSTQPGLKNQKVKPLRKMSSKLHDGPVVFSGDGKKAVITRTRLNVKGKNSINRLELAECKWTDGKWTKPVSILKAGEYSTAHAALSADGTLMVFASDMPGGYGGTDLFFTRFENGAWTQPENLGKAINSPGNEMFPVIHDDGNLWFSSDGHPGFGGKDIFVAEGVDGNWGNAANAGYPLNSTGDDFGIAFDKGKPSGLFTSNRSGGSGGDDIYRFSRKIPVKIYIDDNVTRTEINGSTASIIDTNGKETRATADRTGSIRFFADFGKDFQVTAAAENYISKKEMIDMHSISPMGTVTKNIGLNPDNIVELVMNVKEAGTGLVVPKFTVEIVPVMGSPVKAEGASGMFKRKIELGKDYSLVLKSSGFKPQVIEITTLGKYPGEKVLLQVEMTRGSAIIVEGLVTDQESHRPMEGTRIRAINPEDGSLLANSTSRKDGLFWMLLESGKSVHLLGTQVDYFSSRFVVNKPVTMADTTVKAKIEMIRFGEGKLVATVYYDYKSADITPQAASELSGITWFLVDNPGTKVEIGTHTDARGGNAYNIALSQMRSQSFVDFAGKSGIFKDRIIAKGYGEEMPVNHCRDNVNCTEKEHARNRRAEVRVIQVE